MEHYFIAKEHTENDYFTFKTKIFDQEFVFKSCDDIFSKDRVDYGTKVLIETVAKNFNITGSVLDMGCGYGVIGIALSKLFKNAQFILCDINKTAVELSLENVKTNGVNNITEILVSNAYENISKSFDYIITNPPIKAGKKNLLTILDGAYKHLNSGGKLVFVIKKKHGEDSIKKHLEMLYSQVEILKRDSGYYILSCTK